MDIVRKKPKEDKNSIVEILVNNKSYRVRGLFEIIIDASITPHKNQNKVTELKINDYIIRLDLFLHKFNESFTNSVKGKSVTLILVLDNQSLIILIDCLCIQHSNKIVKRSGNGDSQTPTHKFIAEDVQYNTI